jgi:hypothetical protein
MSTATSTAPDIMSASAAPLIAAYYADMKRPIIPIMLVLVIHSALGAMCVPMLSTLLYFSMARLRRTPLFLLVTVQVIVDISYAAPMVALTVRPNMAVPANEAEARALMAIHLMYMPLYSLVEASSSSYIAIGVTLILRTWIVVSDLYLRRLLSSPSRVSLPASSLACLPSPWPAGSGVSPLVLSIWPNEYPRSPQLR